MDAVEVRLCVRLGREGCQFVFGRGEGGGNKRLRMEGKAYRYMCTVSTNSCPSFAAAGASAAGLLRDTCCLSCRQGL